MNKQYCRLLNIPEQKKNIAHKWLHSGEINNYCRQGWNKCTMPNNILTGYIKLHSLYCKYTLYDI